MDLRVGSLSFVIRISVQFDLGGSIRLRVMITTITSWMSILKKKFSQVWNIWLSFYIIYIIDASCGFYRTQMRELHHVVYPYMYRRRIYLGYLFVFSTVSQFVMYWNVWLYIDICKSWTKRWKTLFGKINFSLEY